ncbi:RNA polymerase III C11 subunit, partial [Elasticomyces elasticus]
MLTITPLPPHQLAPEDSAAAHKNRFECRTCPYQMVLDRRYYERKDFDLKAAESAEEVLGGADSCKNVDRSK